MKVNPLTKKNIFFACSGLGMGNASRIAAIMEALVEQSKLEQLNLTFQVAIWGAGYNFLHEFKKESNFEFDLIKLNSYPKNKSFNKFFYAFFSNSKILKNHFKFYTPDLIILDSDYHWPAYFLSSATKIFIGQAIDVIERAASHKYKFKNYSEKLNMFFKERLDAFYQLFISDLVIVPTFQRLDTKDSRIKKVSLIVRNEFQKIQKNKTSESNKIAVLLSGSEIEKEAFLKLAKDHAIRIFTPNKSQDSFLSHSDALDEFDIIFTQGGLTSISEVIARKIFIVVFPIRNHPEQVLNAIEVEKLGLGIRANLIDLNNFSAFLQSIIDFKNSAQAADLKCSGATQSASLIIELLINSGKTNSSTN